MSLIVFGLNHNSAPVAIREKLAHLNEMTIPEADGIKLEAVPLCTCNRVELYYSGCIKDARASFIELLARKNLKYASLKEYFYEFQGKDCIEHLFKVSSGLDSMIFGENQILHQIKSSYQDAVKKQMVRKELHCLFQKTLEVGKRVRSETLISSNRVSIASAAVELAEEVFGPINNSQALIIGAGEIANLVAVHMREHGVKRMFFINRTQSKAQELATRFKGEACSLDCLQNLLFQCDIVISSTSSAEPIISQSTMREVMKRRKNRTLFAFDIAVPRDIEPECRAIDNLVLYDVDGLKNVVKENLNHRKLESEKATKIISNEVCDFVEALREKLVIPHIQRLKEHAKQQCISELEKFFNQHPELSPELKEACEKHSRQLASKWLHKQITMLKQQGPVSAEDLECLTLDLSSCKDILPFRNAV